MTISALTEEISIELEMMEKVIAEAVSLLNDIADEREPTVREKTAAAAFLAQFYGGIENILKKLKKPPSLLKIWRFFVSIKANFSKTDSRVIYDRRS